ASTTAPAIHAIRTTSDAYKPPPLPPTARAPSLRIGTTRAYYGHGGNDGGPILRNRPELRYSGFRPRGPSDAGCAARGLPPGGTAPGGTPGPTVRADRRADLLPAHHS